MKKNTPLWGSISILIGVVIVILALTRGTLCTVPLSFFIKKQYQSRIIVF